jgi:hypothetical protein
VRCTTEILAKEAFHAAKAGWLVDFNMDLSSEQMAEMRELAGSRDVPAGVALRARIVLWSGEGRRRKDIAELAGVAPLTVDRCKARYAERGLAGLVEKRRGGPRWGGHGRDARGRRAPSPTVPIRLLTRQRAALAQPFNLRQQHG